MIRNYNDNQMISVNLHVPGKKLEPRSKPGKVWPDRDGCGTNGLRPKLGNADGDTDGSGYGPRKAAGCNWYIGLCLIMVLKRKKKD